MRDAIPLAVKYQLRPQRRVLFFAPLEIPRQLPHPLQESEMVSIYGKAMQSTLRELDRAARGCPSIANIGPNIDTGSGSRHAAELDR